MSSDFAFWARASGDPGEVFDALAEGDTSSLEPSESVREFREALKRRWPGIVHMLEPTQRNLDETPDDIRKYVLLTLSYRMLDGWPDILAMAKEHGLTGYSGVGEAPL
jgi:hypothetical protein